MNRLELIKKTYEQNKIARKVKILLMESNKLNEPKIQRKMRSYAFKLADKHKIILW